MQREYYYMPTIFDSATFRAALQRGRRRSLAHAFRVRLNKWHCAIQRRKRQQALEECLRRLDRHTLDDIGLALTSEPIADKVATEIEIRAVGHRSRGIT
jgi:hypothetical protein